MRRPVLLSAVVLSLLFADSLRADTLLLSDRGTMKGSLQELLVRVDGMPRAYSRGELKAAELSGDGDDAIELADGARVQGKVICISFRCADRLYALGRSRVRSVALDAAEVVADTPKPVVEAPPPEQTPEPRARPLTPDEQDAKRRSLERNEALCKQFAAKAQKRGLFGSASKAEDRRKRVLAMAEQVKLDVQSGRFLTDGQMFLRYDAALAGKPFSEPTKTQLRTMTQGVKVNQGTDKNTPELVVEPFPEVKH